MPISLSRLRIAGFKSFADPVTVEIPTGLTGIVGPNGCGKSNVVEALRWAMGETSARSMRGGEMDDVIFTGTEARASRNLAEVTLTLESPDTEGTDTEPGAKLPPPFTGQAELQVCRRIERGSGSAYVINGREVRARDVQHLFADIASGAHSSALVGQGRVAAIIAAKPTERRVLVEEAAGVTGLQARRHEAELKLRSAEANLARAEDLRGQLEQQLASMREQAEQARRYRAIADSLRQSEVALLVALHANAVTALAIARQELEEARAAAEAAQREAATAGAAPRLGTPGAYRASGRGCRAAGGGRRTARRARPRDAGGRPPRRGLGGVGAAARPDGARACPRRNERTRGELGARCADRRGCRARPSGAGGRAGCSARGAAGGGGQSGGAGRRSSRARVAHDFGRGHSAGGGGDRGTCPR